MRIQSSIHTNLERRGFANAINTANQSVGQLLITSAVDMYNLDGPSCLHGSKGVKTAITLHENAPTATVVIFHTHTQPKFLICSAIFRRTSTCLKTKRPNLLFLHQTFIKHHLVTLPAGPSSIHVYPNLYIIWRVVGRCKLDFQTSRSKSLCQTMVYINIRYVSL